MAKRSFRDFVAAARAKHGGLYGYEEAEAGYLNCESRVTIHCKLHGAFKQRAAHHICKTTQGRCPKCSARASRSYLTTAKFVKGAMARHGDKYDYSVTSINKRAKVDIICPIHGLFQARPGIHLGGAGCPACGRAQQAAGVSNDLAAFLERASSVHGDTYDYSAAIYTGAWDKITIICRKHGEFSQAASSHTSGRGVHSASPGGQRQPLSGCSACRPALVLTSNMLRMAVRW